MKRVAGALVVIACACLVVVCMPPFEDGIDDARRMVGSHSGSIKTDIVLKNIREMPPKAVEAALTYYKAHQAIIHNRRFITIIDYTKPSCTKRMFVIDLKTGEVERHFVAHGKNSGRVYATSFSNQSESFKSCRGFFLTGERYTGKRGTTLALHGLEKGVNDNAYNRGIVIHGARYVNLRAVLINKGRLGRSLGCPATSDKEIDGIVKKIKDGSLVYVFVRQ